MHRIFTVALALAVVSPVSLARAQDDFSGLKLKLGSNIRVTDDGLIAEGPLTSLSADALTVADHELRPAAGLKIERDRGHTGLKGMAIGAAAGLAIGLANSRGNGWGTFMMFPGAIWGGLIGVGMDRYVPVYDTTAFGSTTPQLTVRDPPPVETAPIFTGLRAKVGDSVFVTQDGIIVNGPITALSPSRLVVGSREFGAGTSLKIEKEGDPIWDGAVTGFFAGVLLGSCSGCNDGQRVNVLASGLVWAGIGALIDWAHKGKTTIYDATTHREGVASSPTR